MSIVRAVGRLGEMKGRHALHGHTRVDALLALAAERPTARPLPHDGVPTPAYVSQLHGDLYDDAQAGERWRAGDGPTGMLAAAVQFRPPAASQVEELVAGLCAAYRGRVGDDRAELLLIVGAFVLDFLCVSPFDDGSFQAAWLLADSLLRDAGYDVTRYVALGSVVEETLPACGVAFEASAKGWDAAWHDLTPWWGYFLATLTRAHEELEARLEAMPQGRVLKSDAVRKAIEELPAPFSISDLEHACPDVSRPLIRRMMNELKGSRIRLLGRGPRARWERM